jgi:hypothetical protein
MAKPRTDPDGNTIADIARPLAEAGKNVPEIRAEVIKRIPEGVSTKHLQRILQEMRQAGTLDPSPYPGPHRSTGYPR